MGKILKLYLFTDKWSHDQLHRQFNGFYKQAIRTNFIYIY
jgi:hypothetical protein